MNFMSVFFPKHIAHAILKKKYRYSDILLKNYKLEHSVDKTFRVIKIMDFNGTGNRCYSTIFLTPVPAKKRSFFRRLILELSRSFPIDQIQNIKLLWYMHVKSFHAETTFMTFVAYCNVFKVKLFSTIIFIILYHKRVGQFDSRAPPGSKLFP